MSRAVESETESDPWDVLAEQLRTAFQLGDGYRVVIVGEELDLFDSFRVDDDEEVEDDGDLPFLSNEEYADRAIEDRTKTVRAPRGYAFVVLEAEQREPVLLTVKRSDYRL